MSIKIKDSYVAKARSDRIRAYLLSKALKNEYCTDGDIQKIYGLSQTAFDAAVDILIKDGTVEKR